jgi:hypothetical protein
MIDLNKKFQTRIYDSLEKISKDPEASKYSRVSDESLVTMEEKGIQAGFLRNFKERVMDSEEGRDFMKTNNYGPYLPELWPIITAWYPEFPLKDLISVQDMEQDLAYIITSKLLAATNKADTVRGEAVETPSGPRTIHGKYPTGEIFGEELKTADLVVGTGKVEGALAYYPILTDEDSLSMTKVVATISGVEYDDYEFTSLVGTNITYTSAGSSTTAVIDIATGVIEVSSVNTESITVSYVWNIEYANDENIPSVVEDMQMVPLIAKPRVLGMKWTIFSEYLKKKQFGVDIRTQNTKRALDLMYQYQVRYILDRMYNGAQGTPQTLIIPNTTLDLNLKCQKVIEGLNTISMKVQAASGRIEGNQLVVGANLKNFFESLPDTFYKPFEPGKDYGFNGPRKIGKISRYTVYYDDKLDADKAWMTYRGAEWYDAAFYLGVFLPLAPTDAINININVRQAFVEMCAYKYDKPSTVFPINVA